MLDAFKNEVSAQEQAGAMTPDQAQQLRDAADAVKAAIGCSP